MDTDKMSSMYAEIVRGVKKQDSRWCKGSEASEIWDKISAEIEEIKLKKKTPVFDIPNELP